MAQEDPSGVNVYPKMPVPKRQSEPRVKGFSERGGLDMKKVIIGLAGAAVVGGVIGFLVRPTHGGEVEKAKSDAAAAQKTVTEQKTRADQAEEKLATVSKQFEDLSSKSADVDKKAAQLEAEEKKLSGALDKESGSVSTEGNEIHLKLVDKVLFATGDDQLSDKGKQLLDKVGAVLKDIPDKQIWVQGHTDDQPIYAAPKKEAPKPDPHAKKGVKPKEPEKEKLPEALRFHTNWELSAARALEVVHYLQDSTKIDPTRLAALAFGQYRPVSKEKALNRRIEIVLVPKKAVVQKLEPPPAPAKTEAPKK